MNTEQKTITALQRLTHCAWKKSQNAHNGEELRDWQWLKSVTKQMTNSNRYVFLGYKTIWETNNHLSLMVYKKQAGRLTFRRQALVTTCLGSTTSTKGSLMATLRMQLMSNPYTFSHPVHEHNVWSSAPMWMHMITPDFVDFYSLHFLWSLRSNQGACRKRRKRVRR